MKKIRHTGWKVERCRFGLLERIFAERWLAENTRDRFSAGGILQQLFMRTEEGYFSRWKRPRLIISQRDAIVAATVIQWLGTNVGYGFLTDCLRRAGCVIIDKAEYDTLCKRERREDEPWHDETVSDQYYSVHTQNGYEVVPGAWHNFARQFAYEKPPEVKLKQKHSWYMRLQSWAERRKRVTEEIERTKERARWQAEFDEYYRQCQTEQQHFESGIWC